MERPLLFNKCPGAAGRVHWMELGDYPTPVQRMAELGATRGIPGLYVKRDDLSSPFYGGNKVRKLEFLLAEARAKGHRVMVTFGAAGSNHVLATVIHGERAGIETIAVLMPQDNAAYVRKNLIADLAHGAKFVTASSPATMPFAFLKGLKAGYDPVTRRLPYVIPPGGTNLPGCLGFVDGALELKKQVDEGLFPEPEFIFVTYGSGGTSAGLVAGVRLAGLDSRVVSVRVVDRFACNRWILGYHVNRTIDFLRDNCAGHLRSVHPRELLFVDDFAGETYARFTVEGMKAVRAARELEGIDLEGTYTGKTLAGSLDFIHRHGLERRNCLFWNTYSSADLSGGIDGVDYRGLPRELQVYFETPLQEEKIGLPD